jgi:hypothetical protein
MRALQTGLIIGAGALAAGVLTLVSSGGDTGTNLFVGVCFVLSGTLFFGFSVFGMFYLRRRRP